MGGGKDFFANYATHGIALQIPISQLDDSDRAGRRLGDDGAASRVMIREYRRNGVRRFQEQKQWVQVSGSGTR